MRLAEGGIGDRCILIWNIKVAYRENIDSIVVLTKSK